MKTALTAAAPVRSRHCPLCQAPSGEPCQPKPAADHLARYLDAYTAGQLTRAYMRMVLAELVVTDTCAVITVPAQPTRDDFADLRAVQARRAVREPIASRMCGDFPGQWGCTRTYAHPGVHVHHGPDGEVVAWWPQAVRDA